MYFARDVRDKVKTRLEHATYGIKAQLTAINTARSESTKEPAIISYGETKDQFPAIYIDLADSVIDTSRGADYKTLVEVFELQVSAMVTGGDLVDAADNAENYLEAILRCLAGYELNNNDFENFYCRASGVIRQDLGNQKGITMRQVTVTFDIVRNYQY